MVTRYTLFNGREKIIEEGVVVNGVDFLFLDSKGDNVVIIAENERPIGQSRRTTVASWRGPSLYLQSISKGAAYVAESTPTTRQIALRQKGATAEWLLPTRRGLKRLVVERQPAGM